jgi:hypothetical protein
MRRDPHLPVRLIDAVPPDRQTEAALAVIGKDIRQYQQHVEDRVVDVIDKVKEAAAAQAAAAAQVKREARRARLRR